MLRQPRRTQRTVSAPVETRQTASLGGWVKNMLPSYRPERGGTVRERGFWEQLDLRNRGDIRQPRRHANSSHRRHQSGTVDSNCLDEWNIPQDLRKTSPERNTSRSRPRAVSAGITSSLDFEAPRNRSWAPRDDKNWQIVPSFRKRQADKNKDTEYDCPSTVAAIEDDAFPSLTQPPSLPGPLLEAKREAHKQRRSLKQSGDYLGVQGFNPQTGVPDIITPSDSEQSAVSQETDQKLAALKSLSKNAPSETTRSRIEREIRKTLLKKEGERVHRREQAKVALHLGNSSFRWRRQSKQWSSAQEPNLSPIAQSHRSFSPPSRPQSPPNTASTHQGGLIDPGPPKSEPETRNSMNPITVHGELYRDASGSSGTVVQTPHRQSQANMSPAALELFENGIRFDNLDELDSNRQHGILFSTPEPPLDLLNKAKSSKTGACLARQQESPDLPTVNVTTPDNSSIALDSTQAKKTSSFLGMQARNKPRPGEIKENLKGQSTTSSASLPSLSALIKSSPLNHNFNLESSVKAGFFPLENTRNPRSFLHESMTVHPKFDTPQTLPGSRTQHFLPESSSTAIKRRLAQGAQEDQHPNGTRTTLEVQHLSGDGQMKNRDIIETSRLTQLVKDLKLSLDDIPLTEEEIQDDLQRVRRTLASVDQPILTTVKSRSQTWAQGTIRDMASKCNEVVGVSASTPIITTTGYGLPMSISSHSPGQASVTGYQRRRKLSRVIYNLPDLSPMTDSSGSSQTSPTPNTSLNSEPRIETPATDTTLVRHLELAKQRTETLASKGSGDPKLVAAVSHPQCSMSHTSMYTTRQEEPGKNLQDRNKAEVAKRGIIGLACRRHDIPSTVSNEMDETQKPLLEARAETTNLLVRIPGSYPDHLLADVDADADIADHSSGEHHEREGEGKTGTLWDATSEVLYQSGGRGMLDMRRPAGIASA
ncbi:hypothetical protein G7Z17_g6532 [Cylindrodendrum hubeiense]|uniref:Uncharacterized protein n=1 Tax=Cylindrodendrum hubeiense TaxID=595255 RepID=A0A9P5HCY6_9HYPO|nr:hypothetical protein G7Z17_g6532 [Cylindrodendrum hubeiense]